MTTSNQMRRSDSYFPISQCIGQNPKTKSSLQQQRSTISISVLSAGSERHSNSFVIFATFALSSSHSLFLSACPVAMQWDSSTYCRTTPHLTFQSFHFQDDATVPFLHPSSSTSQQVHSPAGANLMRHCAL